MHFSTRSTAAAQPKTFDSKKNNVRVVATTEAPVMVWDWEIYDQVSEILRMDGVELPANGQVPLLDSHSRGSVANILGSARAFKVVDQQLECDVHFSADAHGQDAAQKVRDGHLTDFSVGYEVLESFWVPKGEKSLIGGREYEGPARVVTKWKLKELSATPIGADEQAKARAEAGQRSFKQPILRRENAMKRELIALLVKRGMPETASETEAWTYFNGLDFNEQRSLFNQAGATPEDARAAGIRRAERERCEGIRSRCRAAGLDEVTAEDMIQRELSLEVAGQEIFRALEKKNPPVGAHSRYQLGHDAADKRRDAAVDGLCLRAGVRFENAAHGAREYRNMSLFDIGRECLAASGANIRGMSRRQVADRIFSGQGRGFSQRASVSDFPALLANVANKILRQVYEQAPSTWQLWCREGDAADYKEMSRNQISEAPELLLINEFGEYKEGNFGDAKEVFKIQKFGRLFGLSREAFINDDLSAFDSIPKAFALASSRKINETAYGILTTNAAMADGIALFHADHNNLASVAGVLSTEKLSDGRAAMRQQRGLNNVLINVAPKFVIVPAAQETAADIILNSAGYPEDYKSEGVRNPFFGKLETVVEPLLDQTSSAAWYLAADPSQIDTVEVAFLDGEPRPYVEDRVKFEDDRLEWKCRLEFGAKAIDWRGLYKNAGE